MTFVSPTIGKCIHGYYIQSRMNGFVLDVERHITQSGAPIVVSPMETEMHDLLSHQLWLFDFDGTIHGKGTGMVIDISCDTNATNLIVRPKNAEANQRWIRDSVYLVSRHTDRVINIERENPSTGANVIAWTKHGDLNQQWDIVPKFC